MFCSYCGKDKSEDEFTAEHVIPRALIGGGLEPTNPFILRTVCRKCNTLCGRYVDRPFIKNWFLQNGRALNTRRYIDLSRNPEISLIYLGALKESPIPGKTCDCWTGPAGDLIIHVHDPYLDLTEVGIPLNIPGQAYDSGIVILYIRATNPLWQKCILKSIASVFDGSDLYIGNTPNPPSPFQKIPASLEDLQSKIIEIVKKPNMNLQFSMRVDYGDRFLSKLAIGFGCLLLTPDYPASEDAQRLRAFLWERNPDKRAEKLLYGTGFVGKSKDPITEKYIAWSPGHIFTIMDFGDKLILIPIFYGSQMAAIEIARNRALWTGRIPEDGIVYVVSPGFKQWMPAKLTHYIAAREGLLPDKDKLVSFLKMVENGVEVPPVILPSNV